MENWKTLKVFFVSAMIINQVISFNLGSIWQILFYVVFFACAQFFFRSWSIHECTTANQQTCKKLSSLMRFFTILRTTRLYSEYFEQLKRNRLQGLHKCSRTFNYTYSKEFMFLVSQIKLIKRTKRLELNFNIEFEGVDLSTTFTTREQLWNHLCYSMLKNAWQKSSHAVLLSRLGWKYLHIKAEKNILG